MLVYVLSDTHGDCQSFFDKYRELLTPDAMIHLGDYAEDAQKIEAQTGIPMFYVKGNGDWFEEGVPQEKILTLCGHRILLVHGHNEKVSRGLETLYFKSMEKQVELALFGHTHIPLDIESGGIRLMNPGSPSKPRNLRMEKSFLRLEINFESIIAEFVYL